MFVRVGSTPAAIAVWAASEEMEASRSKTWQNHLQGKLLACLHKLCWSLLNLRTRSLGYRKPDIPTRRSYASWSVNSSPRRTSCVTNISRSSCKSTNRRSGESGRGKRNPSGDMDDEATSNCPAMAVLVRIKRRRKLRTWSHRMIAMHGVLHRRRVFLRRRVVLFDHEVDRHAVQLLEHKRAIDRRVLDQGLADLAELELILGRGQFDAAMRLNEQPMLDDLRTEFAIFFDNLIENAGTDSVNSRPKERLRFVAVVFDLNDAGIGAGSARRRLANPRMPDL